MPAEPRIVATRIVETATGGLTLHFSDTTADIPTCRYDLIDETGVVTDSMEVYGEDSVQALLFAITAAGDYLQRFVPSASFVGLGTHGLLTTDLSAADQWRAHVVLPAGEVDLPPD
ncbi:hypothetical protein M3C63_09100 [Brevibacterium luteolum]|uniref:hypothetical protein n=1 Tax=Brevibacterium luteolum TaxID=199591 RepID=UPI00223B5694|nr:hypothetical protein [Brevibacterium luteolum]MCT1922013.1 hypothetical protein [Brevibacterium luteolum]